MAPIPKNSIDHFTHPGHPLIPFDTTNDYLCDGCKTVGSGKKYRCKNQTCDFDLHEYCATCPRTLSSSMHPTHPLTLVMRKPQGTRQVDRVCDVCADPVEGLFYRCKDCEFDVHPLCTQLPERLQHTLHKLHSLDLQSPGKPGPCAVCRGTCDRWRYRCGACDFNIHLECVLVPVAPYPETAETSQRGFPRFDNGIPFQPPPHYGFPPYGAANPFGTGSSYGPGNPYGHGNFFHAYNPQSFNPGYFTPPQIYYQAPGAPPGNNNKKKKSMFALVGQLGFGVLSNMVFGVDLSSMFAG